MVRVRRSMLKRHSKTSGVWSDKRIWCIIKSVFKHKSQTDLKRQVQRLNSSSTIFNTHSTSSGEVNDLFRAIKPEKCSHLVLPCCGSLQFKKDVVEHGSNLKSVFAFDIKAVKGLERYDLFKPECWKDRIVQDMTMVIMSPPWEVCEPYIAAALTVFHKSMVCFHVRSTWLTQSAKRREWWLSLGARAFEVPCRAVSNNRGMLGSGTWIVIAPSKRFLIRNSIVKRICVTH